MRVLAFGRDLSAVEPGVTVDRRTLEAFVAVAEAGGYQQAAAALHLSQPGVSRRILALEANTRLVMFDRTNRGARLTNEGAAFLPVAREVLRALAEADQAVRSIAAGRRRMAAVSAKAD